MKVKEIRALARENLKQIPKKVYMSMGLLLIVANIIPMSLTKPLTPSPGPEPTSSFSFWKSRPRF